MQERSIIIEETPMPVLVVKKPFHIRSVRGNLFPEFFFLEHLQEEKAMGVAENELIDQKTNLINCMY